MMEMNEMMMLALSQAVDEEFDAWEERVAKMEEPEFSESFYQGMEKIVLASKQKYVIVRRRGVRRTALIAAVLTLLLAASAVVVAMNAPQIRSFIEKNMVAWDVTFEQEDPEGLMPRAFEYILPEVPEGYEVVEENENPSHHTIIYRNEEGDSLYYSQFDVTGAGIGLDAEGEYIMELEINGMHAISFSDGTDNGLLFDNGYYGFYLQGTCSMETLIDIAKSIQ